MPTKLLHVKALVNKEAQVEEGIIEAIVGSSDVVDRMGDTIDQDGWILDNFKKNPVILWGHNVREDRPPIGKATKVWLEGIRKKKLMFSVKFDLQDTFAADIYRKIREGFINAVSVGFQPLEWLDNEFLKMDLLELSFVPIPANPQALVSIRELGDEPVQDMKELFKQRELTEFSDLKILETKKVIPFKDLGASPISDSWDGPGEKARASIDDLKLMSAWFDDGAPDKKGSYLLPHHKQVDKKAVWRGVAAAMAVLLGGKDGVDIPESDRRSVYNHLAKHYKQFDRLAPDFRMVEEQVLKGFTEEIGALILEREDKHVVRLLKHLIKLVKTKQNEARKMPIEPSQDDVANALHVLDVALGKVSKLN